MKKIPSVPPVRGGKDRILARALAEDLRTVQGSGVLHASTVSVDKSSDGHTDITNGTGDHDVTEI
ncbi:MAG TPA: hypothetical protein VIE43_27490 [Thermoanaerobaculia bacterium]|jgi:hypothetical protein|nr:hypothetical protein [Thermoanaerobaculia bacterium]